MATVSLLDFKTNIKFRAQFEGVDFVDDPQLTALINSSVSMFVEIISSATQDYFIDSFEQTYTGSQDGYEKGFLAMPQDVVHEIRGVDYILDSTQSATLQTFNFQERNRFKSPFWPLTTTRTQSFYKFRPHKDGLLIIPEPNVGEKFRLWYTPVLPNLQNDTDTMQVFNRWDEWIILDVTIKLLTAEGTDVSDLRLERQAQLDRLLKAAARRQSAGARVGMDIYELDADPFPYNGYNDY